MKFLKTVIDNIHKANLNQQKTLILTTNAQSIRYLQTEIKSRISTLDSLVLAKFQTTTNLELLIKLFSSYKKFILELILINSLDLVVLFYTTSMSSIDVSSTPKIFSLASQHKNNCQQLFLNYHLNNNKLFSNSGSHSK